jgi:flagellar biosynthesis protein FlhG
VKNGDQAATLRALTDAKVISLRPPRRRLISVTGGKGGVGKSTIAINLAATYAARGSDVVAFDGDFGMADLNLLLGVAPERSMLDLLAGRSLEEVMVAAHGIHLLPGANGSHRLANLEIEEREHLLDCLALLKERFDTVVVDTAAGIQEDTVALAAAAADVIVVATPEPLSLADAYACLKMLATRHAVKRALLLPNAVRCEREAEEIVVQLSALVRRFLPIELFVLPSIPYDPVVRDAGAKGLPLIIERPESPASRAIQRVASFIDAAARSEDEGRRRVSP